MIFFVPFQLRNHRRDWSSTQDLVEGHHHRNINNPLERLHREIRRRTRVVGCFPDGRSAVMLVTARLAQ